MPEHDPVVLAYSHLRDFPRAPDALQILRRVASLVKPLMRARRWKVRELSEFYPDQANLLGLNINKGQKILLRLRYPGGDASLFLPLDQIADTLLHELAHIVHGPHDAVFHALWNQLRDEHMALTLKGFTGEGFLSEGHRLGGSSRGSNGNSSSSSWTPTGAIAGVASTANHLRRPIPMDEARRLAKAAAERRLAKAAASAEKERSSRRNNTGHRLGGSSSSAAHPPPPPPSDIRRVVADAVARRNSHTPDTMRGCATDGPQYNDQTRATLVEQASRNGFRTQAEEDAANEAAIAQALWELVQEDERQRLGDQYVPPTAERPEGSGGWLSVPATTSWSSGRRGSSSSPIVIDVDAMEVDSPRHRPPPPPPTPRTRRSSISAPPPGTATRHSRPVPPSQGPKPGSKPDSSPKSSSSSSRGWTCGICTLHNPSTFLICDACGVERTSSSSPPKEKARESSTSNSRPGHSSSSSSSHRHSSQPPPITHRPTPPSPAPSLSRRSHAVSNAAATASSRASQQVSHQKPKKKVTFTPSTRGGSITSMISTSTRARPGSSPPSNSGSNVLLKRGRSTPPPGASARPQVAPIQAASTDRGSSDASSTWMCTVCWKNMGRKYAACDSCGKPKEAWQQ